jgi:ATP-dependent DNA helicase RecQ
MDGARVVLREVFGYDDFRAGQHESVGAVLAGRDAVVLLPTGGGKSLCYQVPALVRSRRGEGTTLVISPLIALMKDQVDALCGRGVRAAAINSHQDELEQRQVTASVERGEIELLYVSPERAALPSFRRLLERISVALLAIDEAHCLSQWGHDFRPDYLALHELAEDIDAPTIALTATATPRVMDEIVERLALTDPTIVRGDFRRPNLAFSVRHLRSDAARIAATVAALDEAGLRSKIGRGRAIVYCATRKKTEAVAKALASAGFATGHYHAGRTQLARQRVQRAFEQGKKRVLVATNAFGMGIDYPDVRLLVHFQAPGSLEAYYQEAGRAGRDGEPARCLLLFGPGDLVTQRRLQSGNRASASLEARHTAALAAIERYASEIRCRQATLCAHFTGVDEPLRCGRCDVCEDPEAVGEILGHDEGMPPIPLETLDEAGRACIVEAVTNLRRPVGKTSLAKALRGSRAKALKRLGLLELPEHGALRRHDEAVLVAAIEALLAEGVLERRGQKYPTVWLPGRPVRSTAATPSTRKAPRRPRHSELARALDRYRRKVARSLDWKPYMVFQRRVIASIDKERPRTRAALGRIPGLGPAKIDRFGTDLLALVRRHAGDA